MPGGRPPSAIDNYRQEIKGLLEIGESVDSILQVLVVQIGRPLSKRTLERRIQTWGLQRYKRVTVTDDLVEHIRFLFFTRGWDDEAILRSLQAMGIDTSLRTV